MPNDVLKWKEKKYTNTKGKKSEKKNTKNEIIHRIHIFPFTNLALTLIRFFERSCPWR